MRFGSVCSGIEAASVAWHPLGWEAAWLSEIEPFPCAVLKHHYPDVPNYGDMTLLPDRILSGEVEAPDLFCGGTPCQAFSVAGLRNSLDDARGNLSLTFVGIANAIDHVRSVRRDAPAIIFWENVPGVLNTKDNAFGCFLGALAGESDPVIAPGDKWSNAGCVYGPQRTVAWRVLDAQYFGVAQRRRRVFVVASARNDFDPTEVLFEFEGVRRDIAPSRETGQRPTARSEDSTQSSSKGLLGGGNCGVELSGPLSARDYKDAGTDGMNKISAKMIPVMQELVGALDTQCGGNKMSHQTIASGHLLPVKSFYESSLAQYREANVSGTIKRSGGVAGGGSETFLAQPAYAIQGSMIGRNDNAGPQGDGINVEVCFTQNTIDRHAVAHPIAYSFDSLASNSMKSSNPHSGCNPVDVSRSLDTSRGLDPSCNQGGIAVAQPISQIVGALACNTGPNGHDAGNFACNQAVDAGHVIPMAQPIAFQLSGDRDNPSVSVSEDRAFCIPANPMSDRGQAVAHPIVLMDQGGGVMNVQTDGTTGTLRRETHGHEPVVMQPIPFQETADCLTAAYGTKWNGNASATNGSLFAAQPILGGWDYENNAHGPDDVTGPLLKGSPTGGGRPLPAIALQSMAVRRLTPTECERLQGFPDGYTNIPWRKALESPDGPRYKALGNSWAVPVVRWIGKRIQERITT